jgi:Holliday junction resolvasome RuvABC DNA-binding subunit
MAGAHVGAVVHGDAHVGAIANRNAHVGAPMKLDAAIFCTQAKEALVGLGWKPAIAQAAVAAASTALGAEATLERLIFEALRRCPKPTS